VILPALLATKSSSVSYHANAVHFDGATWLINAALASVDNGTLSFSVWLKSAMVPNGIVWIADPEVDYLSNFSVDGPSTPDKYITSIYTAGEAQYLTLILDGPPAVWTHIIGSADVRRGTPVYVCYIADVSLGQPPIDTGGFTGSSTLPFNGLPFWVAFDSFAGDEYTGDMADLWVAPGVSLLDGSGLIPEATRRHFITAGGKPVNPTAYMGLYGGAVMLSGDAATFANNQGSGGAFITTGALTNALTSPSD
jgi:hypothetical protein